MEKRSVSASVQNATVTVEPVLYDVTLTALPSDGSFTLTGDNSVTSGGTPRAIDGFPYTVTIGDYNTDNYSYEYSLVIGSSGTPATPTVNSSGVITIPGDKVTGAIQMTVTRTPRVTVEIRSDYVTGWILVTAANEVATATNIYACDDHPMYYVEAYNAYAYLIQKPEGTETFTADNVKEKITVVTAPAGTIPGSVTSVNGDEVTDYSDVLLTYRCYRVKYETPDSAMETYLRADVNGDKKVDTADVSAVDNNRT